jgi:GT2 family glycosyltransferase
MQADSELLLNMTARTAASVMLGHIPLDPASPPGFLSAHAGRTRARDPRQEALEFHDFLTGQMSLRRDRFFNVGGFDTGFTRDGTFGGEDLDLSRRLVAAGARIVFNPDAISRRLRSL